MVGKKLFIKTFGCQMNEYDSEKIADLLAKTHDFVTTENIEEADLIVFNTCSVREKAAEKLFSDLGRCRPLKKKNPDLVFAVGGCVSQQEKENIFRRAPLVDIVFGPQTLHRLPKLYEKACQKERKLIDTEQVQIEKFDYFPVPSKKGAVAYVSIMEGCNKFCSYCIVPYTRGREVSRPFLDIIAEVIFLVDQGVKEIHLLGQNVNSYSSFSVITRLDRVISSAKQKDCPIKSGNDVIGLADLIKEIAKIKEIQRIRFTTSHPKEFSDDLIGLFKNERKLVDHLHLPIQSGSNKILELMRRGYTREDYKEIIEKLRKVRPNIAISTDFIVGFPDESEEDFADTMEIVKDINFDGSFSFIYSPRPNTPAAKMNDDVGFAEKKRRLEILQNQLSLQAREYSKNMIGTLQKVLITSYSKKNQEQFSGRTENNRVVNFLAEGDLLGKMVEVKITEALSNSLRGSCYGYCEG